MRWIISLLDFRLWNGAGQGGGGQGGGGQGGGGQGGGGQGGGGPDQGGGGEPGYGHSRQRWAPRSFAPPAPPTVEEPAAPATPPREPGPTTERHYARHLEDVRQRNRSAASMPAFAQDYEIPDTAFGTRIY